MISLAPETLVSAIICLNFFSIGIYAFLVKHNRGNGILFFVSFCVFLGLNQLYDILIFNKIYGRYLSYLDEFSLLVAFPSLYFYVISLTQRSIHFRMKDIIHLLPILLFVLLWVIPSSPETTTGYHGILKFIYPYYNKIQGIIYILLINIRLNKHQKYLKDLSSTAKENELSWIRIMVFILFFITIVWTISGFEKDVFNITGIAIMIFSYWIGYHVIFQKNMYVSISPDFDIATLKKSANSYKNSTLSTHEKFDMATRIRQLMAKEKPYLINELTLTSLADKLQMKPIHLSQVLNEEFKENFYNFINRYRVEESKILLADPGYANYNILGIALEAGFNSKSTFNKAFKELTGISPSEFQRSLIRPS